MDPSLRYSNGSTSGYCGARMEDSGNRDGRTVNWDARICSVNGQQKVPTYGHEKSPPRRTFQAFVDGPPALVLASFIR